MMTKNQQISRFLLPIFVCGIIGLVTGFWLVRNVQNSDVRSWKPLPPVPAEATELIPTGDRYIKVRVADGTTYRYQEDQVPTWVTDDDSLSPSAFMDIQKPCDANALAITKASNLPYHWQDCVQQSMSWPEGLEEYTYVIDQNGVVWEAFHDKYEGVSGNADMVVILFFGLIGLLAGSAIGVVISIASPKLGQQKKR